MKIILIVLSLVLIQSISKIKRIKRTKSSTKDFISDDPCTHHVFSVPTDYIVHPDTPNPCLPNYVNPVTVFHPQQVVHYANPQPMVQYDNPIHYTTSQPNIIPIMTSHLIEHPGMNLPYPNPRLVHEPIIGYMDNVYHHVMNRRFKKHKHNK